MCDYNQPCEDGLFCSMTGSTGVCSGEPLLWTDQLYQSLNTPYRKWDTTFHKNPSCTYTSLKFNIKDWKLGEDEGGVLMYSKNGKEYRSTVVSEFPMDLFNSFALEDIITKECKQPDSTHIKEFHLLWKVLRPPQHVGDFGVVPFVSLYEQLTLEDDSLLEFFRDDFLEKATDVYNRVNSKIDLPLQNLKDHLVFIGSLDGSFDLVLNTVIPTEVDRLQPKEATIAEFTNYLFGDSIDYGMIRPRFRMMSDSPEPVMDHAAEKLFISKLEDILYRARDEY